MSCNKALAHPSSRLLTMHTQFEGNSNLPGTVVKAHCLRFTASPLHPFMAPFDGLDNTLAVGFSIQHRTVPVCSHPGCQQQKRDSHAYCQVCLVQAVSTCFSFRMTQ